MFRKTRKNRVDIAGPCQRPVLDKQMKERSEYTPDRYHGQEHYLQAVRSIFLKSLRLRVFAGKPASQTTAEGVRAKTRSSSEGFFKMTRTVRGSFYRLFKTRSTSRLMRPVIIYHIILKSLMNDQNGYLKLAGLFFSMTK